MSPKLWRASREQPLETTSREFPRLAREALGQPTLQRSLEGMRKAMPALRKAALAELPDHAQLRAEAREIRDRALRNLGRYLEQFESRVQESGGEVHWA